MSARFRLDLHSRQTVRPTVDRSGNRSVISSGQRTPVVGRPTERTVKTTRHTRGQSASGGTGQLPFTVCIRVRTACPRARVRNRKISKTPKNTNFTDSSSSAYTTPRERFHSRRRRRKKPIALSFWPPDVRLCRVVVVSLLQYTLINRVRASRRVFYWKICFPHRRRRRADDCESDSSAYVRTPPPYDVRRVGATPEGSGNT